MTIHKIADLLYKTNAILSGMEALEPYPKVSWWRLFKWRVSKMFWGLR